MRNLVIALFIILYSLFTPRIIFAEYALPYPSYMPGNKLYVVSKILDRAKSWWYWGAIGQTKYHMMLSDKYLVEAKTLFEYKQYLLAINALRLSDEHIAEAPKYITMGKSRGVDMVQFESLFTAELTVHRTVLEKLKTELPKTFIWTPEKQPVTTINIDGLLSAAITLRAQQ